MVFQAKVRVSSQQSLPLVVVGQNISLPLVVVGQNILLSCICWSSSPALVGVAREQRRMAHLAFVGLPPLLVLCVSSSA